MPYTIKKIKPSKNSKGEMCSYGVFKKDGGGLVGKTKSHASAIAYIASLHANAK